MTKSSMTWSVPRTEKEEERRRERKKEGKEGRKEEGREGKREGGRDEEKKEIRQGGKQLSVKQSIIFNA